MVKRGKDRIMIAVFYDRKHECEVTSEQLILINYVTDLVCKQDNKEYIHELRLGEYGYKSSECKKFQNWDRAVMFTDLVFLRLECTKEELENDS